MSDLCANSSVPLYCQLASKIQEDIYSGILKPDEQIPPEFDLSEMYQVSRSTVRKAIAKLVSDDLLIKIHGKGTFVAPPRMRGDFAGRQRTLRNLAVFAKRATQRCKTFVAYGQRRSVLRRHGRAFANGNARGSRTTSHMAHGQKNFRRQRHHDEQGAGDHRSAVAVRYDGDRLRDPPAKHYSFHGGICGRRRVGATLRAGHAVAHSVGAFVAGAHGIGYSAASATRYDVFAAAGGFVPVARFGQTVFAFGRKRSVYSQCGQRGGRGIVFTQANLVPANRATCRAHLGVRANRHRPHARRSICNTQRSVRQTDARLYQLTGCML